MKVIAFTLALMVGGLAVASTANAGWTGNRIGNFSYWNNPSTGQSFSCTRIGQFDQAHVVHKPRLLSDNGSSYVSGELAEWLGDRKMGHVRGAPYHPQTQGKIERWHQTLKNRILLENYFFPADLEAQIEAFVDHCNHRRYHESINNLIPADLYFGRGQAILNQRKRIKLKTMNTRRLQYRKYAA